MRDLIERLEKAQGADRELGRSVAVWAMPNLADLPRHGDGWLHPHFGKVAPPPDYTASIDAALALAEEVLPGCFWRVGFDPDDQSIKAELVTDAPECRRIVANHDIPALAILIATLKAKEAGQ